eukprot:scaffold8210_cov102-Isochrysis_galbana.AAC.1
MAGPAEPELAAAGPIAGPLPAELDGADASGPAVQAAAVGAATDGASEEESVERLLKKREGSRLLSRQASRRENISRTSSSRQPSRNSSARRSKSPSPQASCRSSRGGRVGAPVCASAGSADIAVPSGASSVNGEYGSNPFWRSSAASARSCIAAGDDDLGRQTWSSSRLRFSGNASGAADGFESCHPRVATPVAAGSRTSSLRSPCPSRPGSHAGARPSSGSASVFGRLLSLGRGGVAVVPLPPPSREDAIAAAKEGSVDVLSEWLHHHLDQINDEVEDGYTLLHLAAEEGRVGAVKLLLSLGAAVETVRTSALGVVRG